MFVPFLDQFLQGHVLRVKAHARCAIALHFALYPHENFAVDRLRACIATPQTTRDGGEQEQRKCGDDQQACQINEVLWIENDAKNIKAPDTQIKEHRLALPPL